jgi:hypothetical protein
MQDQLPDGVTIVPVISASDETHLTSVLGDQHALPVHFMIGNIRKDIRHIPIMRNLVHVWLISCALKCAKNTD